MKFLAILLCISIVAVVTAVQDSLQHVLQEAEQLKRSNEAMKKHYDEKIASLEHQSKRGRSVLPESVPVAFSTHLTDDTGINDNPVKFDVVALNIGGGYDEFSGVFQPPVDGVYQLTFYGLIATSNEGQVYIKQNETILCRGYLRAEQYDTATCTAIAELTTYDSVLVTGNNDNPADLRGGLESGFTGFLIYDS